MRLFTRSGKLKAAASSFLGSVFVGRELEIRMLSQHLDSVLNGKGTTVFISGEAGVGKTKLVNEFLGLAEKMGIRVLKGWCLSEVAPSYFPFTEAINSLMSVISDEKAKIAMTKQLRPTGWLEGSGFMQTFETDDLYLAPKIEKDKTFEAVTRTFLSLSSEEPLILFLDDMHWADHLSLALLHYLARKSGNSKLLIIGTYRSEEIIPSKEEAVHPLQNTLHSMSREDLMVKIELNPLKRTDFPELLEAVLCSSVEEAFLEKLYEATWGNPFFTLETLNMLVDEGLISEKEGKWRLTVPTEKLRIPSKVHEVITRRIAGLSHGERKLLDLAAVCGHSISPDTVSKILKLDISNVLRTLAEIEQKHRLLRSADSTFEFAHQNIREVIYKNLPNELRRVYHRETASFLEQVLDERTLGSNLADITFHYIAGGSPQKAFEYLIKLGKRNVHIFANKQAIAHLNNALDAITETPELAKDENFAEIYKLRGIALMHEEEPPLTKARDSFSLMMQNALNIGDESMVAEAHFWLGSSYSPYFGEFDEAMQHYSTALKMARKTGNRLLEGRCLAKIGGTLIANDETNEEGRIQLEEALQVCTETGNKAAVSSILQQLGWYFNWKGEFTLAKKNLYNAITLVEELGGIPALTSNLFMLTIALAGNGEYNEAISTGQRCLQLARDSGLWDQVSWMLNTLGWIYHDLSSIELALKFNTESLEFAKAHGKEWAWGGVPHALVNLGEDYLAKNDYENAEKYFKEASDKEQQHPAGWRRLQGHIFLGRGKVMLRKGDYSQALKFSEDSLVLAEKAGAKKYIAKGFQLKAEALAKKGHLRESIDSMQNALKLAQQVGNPPLLWEIRYNLGLLLEKLGDSKKSNEHLTEALSLIMTTAAKLTDTSLKIALRTAPLTKMIRDACAERADRITTGCVEVDDLLLGGIPKNYAVLLTSPSCDERDTIVTKFLETGLREGQPTFYVTTRSSGLESLAELLQPHSCIVVCNPHVEETLKSCPNVLNLSGVENLTEINIALTSAFRKLDASEKLPRRACIEIASDVLLQHRAVNTRRWLNSLVSELKSKDFTTLVLMNPHMHSQEEVQSVLDLFDGEINIYEKEGREGEGKFLKILRIYRQRYLESEALLKKA